MESRQKKMEANSSTWESRHVFAAYRGPEKPRLLEPFLQDTDAVLRTFMSVPRTFSRFNHLKTRREDASNVYLGLLGQAHLYSAQGSPRPGHQVGPSRTLLARRQMVPPAGDAEAAIRAAPDPEE